MIAGERTWLVKAKWMMWWFSESFSPASSWYAQWHHLQDVASRPWKWCKPQRDKEKVENRSWLPEKGTRYPGGGEFSNIYISISPNKILLIMIPFCSCNLKEVLSVILWKGQRSRSPTSQHLSTPSHNSCKLSKLNLNRPGTFMWQKIEEGSKNWPTSWHWSTPSPNNCDLNISFQEKSYDWNRPNIVKGSKNEIAHWPNNIFKHHHPTAGTDPETRK